MSDCTKYNTLISAAVDGELDIDEKAQLEAHLRSCGQCRSYLEIMRKMSEALRDSAEEPPEKLSEWIMADVKLHNSRRIFGAYGRYTALAAVICLVILGAAALRPRLTAGKNGLKAADSVVEAPMAVYADQSVTGEESASDGGDDAAYGLHADAEAGPGKEANGEAYAVGTYPADAAEDESEYKYANGEPVPDAAFSGYDGYGQNASEEEDAFVSEFETSRGYKKYTAMDYEEKFFEVAVIYGEAPDELDGCEILLSEGEQTDYRVPKELMQSLGSEGVFSEIYFNDLLSDYGLVMVLKG